MEFYELISRMINPSAAEYLSSIFENRKQLYQALEQANKRIEVLEAEKSRLQSELDNKNVDALPAKE